ncbi:hypothetical protein Tsubulata_028836 [Turnera subulata]|uniref:UBX domain-containing protein n=1 Tax=Turnera subulata TaxID=218843 RepID=A0A9Q0JA56_9ROSI|nr:hypothetical protein Tsubulata_028836 [Turnera subulata]
MARPNQEAIDTFMSITGATEDVALLRLEAHGGDLNSAVYAHFNRGDRGATRENAVVVPEDDAMDIDDPVEDPLPRRDPLSLLSEAGRINPFSLLDPQFRRSIFDGGPGLTNRDPVVSQPREVREVPIEFKDGGNGSRRTGLGIVIEDVTGTESSHGPDNRGPVIIEDEDDDVANDLSRRGLPRQNERRGDVSGNNSQEGRVTPSAPRFDQLPDYSSEIEEEMIRAAIEASKRDAGDVDVTEPQRRHSDLEDAELEHVVSLSLQTAEREKAIREQKGKVGTSEVGNNLANLEQEKIMAPNGRLETGSTSIQEQGEDVEEQPLVRHRSRRSSSMESADAVRAVDVSPPSSPGRNNTDGHPSNNGNVFPSDEWGGISSEEHDEAVMLEAAMFGGVPEQPGYRIPHAPHEFMQSRDLYPRPTPRPPSPSLQAQRLIREQQDDEYLASLAADREKEIKAMEEAEARLSQERQKEEEARRKLEEEQELERQLAAKEASLPQEPAADDENAVTLLVRMPDGTRRGRRFLRSDKLQVLFDFIDIGKAVKPGTYRLVRPYPRRAFSDGESAVTLNELGLTSKQEALFLELI